MTHTQTGTHTPTSASTGAHVRVHTHTHESTQAHTPEHTPTDTSADTHTRTRTRKALVMREPDAIGGRSNAKRGSHNTIVVEGLFFRYILSFYRGPGEACGKSNLEIYTERLTKRQVVKRRQQLRWEARNAQGHE